MAIRRIISPALSLGIATFQMKLALSQENGDSDSPIEKMRQAAANFNAETFEMKDIEVLLYDWVENGAPGKIGYGFLMGYSSGFCLKKVSRQSPVADCCLLRSLQVSKLAAFSLGGVFILVQALSSQGYLVVNHEKIQREVEVSE